MLALELERQTLNAQHVQLGVKNQQGFLYKCDKICKKTNVVVYFFKILNRLLLDIKNSKLRLIKFLLYF